MFKTIVQRCALVLALMFLTLPAHRLHAQSTVTTLDAVTGGDPQPPPPPKPKPNVEMPIMVLTALTMLGLA